MLQRTLALTAVRDPECQTKLVTLYTKSMAVPVAGCATDSCLATLHPLQPFISKTISFRLLLNCSLNSLPENKEVDYTLYSPEGVCLSQSFLQQTVCMCVCSVYISSWSHNHIHGKHLYRIRNQVHFPHTIIII